MKIAEIERRREHQQHLLPPAPQEPVVDRSDEHAEDDQDREIRAGRHAADRRESAAGSRARRWCPSRGAPFAGSAQFASWQPVRRRAARWRARAAVIAADVGRWMRPKR